jgi:hypothetical protein
MEFVPLSKIKDQDQDLQFVPLQFVPLQSEPTDPSELILSPEERVMSAVGAPEEPAPPRRAAPTQPELRPYEPTILERIQGLIPGNRAKAANEYAARQIAKEQGISVDEAYRQMKESLGVRGVMGGRPSGQPMFNPEGRAPIKAVAEAAPYVFEGLLDIPKGMGEAALRTYRAGDIENAVDTGTVDRMITYLGDESKDIFIPNIPERLGLDKKDPNYQGFMGLGKSLGYSLTTMVASATAGTAATVTTGSPIAGVAAGMGTSGAVAYRASKDDFLNRLRDKLNKDSERVYNRPMSNEEWDKAKKSFNAAAVEYGAWEAIPEAISNAIFLKAFAAPVKGAKGAKLAGYLEKATSIAAENVTETATGLGQNAAELKAGLTEDEITVADAFKQQFIQTMLTMGVTAGGMKGVEYANKYYNEQVLPKIDPASALAKAIKADMEHAGYTNAAFRMKSALEQEGRPPNLPVAPVVLPPSGEPPEEPEVQAAAPAAPAEPTLTFEPLVAGQDVYGRTEPSLEGGAPQRVVRPEDLAAEALPGMPTGTELEEPTVTPVTPAEPSQAQVAVTEAAVKPTPAAAALPEVATVPPVTTPKTFEPAAPQHELQGLATQEVPLKDLKLSKDVPQFKIGASDKGVVEPLGGKFERTGVAPIQVWRRLDGSLEVISGRHRFDLAQRSGEETIPAQIHDESQGFGKLQAAILDAELNIRDGQGKVKDYVNYFKESGIDRETADARGLLARATGKRSFTIANQGSDELVAAVRGDQIGDEAAYYIALNAPSDPRLQGVGIKAVMDGKSMNTAVNTMQAVKALAGENDTTTDMFGFDDSAIKEAEEMAKIAASKQREIQTRLSAISGAAKNPAVAKAEGIDVKDPEAVQKRIGELRQLKSAWDNWSTSPQLVAEIRAARGVAAPELTPIEEPLLTAQTREDLQAKADAEAQAARQQSLAEQEAERKAQADREVGEFMLTGSDRAADVAAAQGQQDIFGMAAEEPAAFSSNQVVKKYTDLLQEQQVTVSYEDYEGGQAKTETYEWEGEIPRADFDALAAVSAKTSLAVGAKYSILLVNTPQESATITWQPRSYTATQPRIEVFMMLNRSALTTPEVVEATPVSTEYEQAIEKSNVAIRKFKDIQEKYRAQEIGDEEFLAGRREYDKAMAEFDEAMRKEQEASEEVSDTQDRIISMTRDEYRLDKATQGVSDHPALAIDIDSKDVKQLLSEYGEKNVRFLGRLYGINVKDIKSVAKKLIDIHNNMELVDGRPVDEFKVMTKAQLEPILKQLGISNYGQKWQLVDRITRYAPDIIKAFNQRLQDAKHQAAVTNALRQGKDVRDEVLKDYPELTPYVRGRDTELYQEAIRKLATKETSQLRGMEWKEHAQGLRDQVKDETDEKVKQVWEDVAAEIDTRYDKMFQKRAEVAEKLATATAPTMQSMMAEQKRMEEEAAAEAAKPAAELTTKEREEEIARINAQMKKLILEQIKLPIEDEAREAEIDKEVLALNIRLQELSGKKPKQAPVIEKKAALSAAEVEQMKQSLVELQRDLATVIGNAGKQRIQDDIDAIEQDLRDAGIDPRTFAIEANEELGDDVVNDEKPAESLPSNQRLLLLPCSDMKAPAAAPAMELYKGVFFQTYKSNVQPGAFPLVVILSAKHGFVNADEQIAPYDEVMSAQRADTMLADLSKYVTKANWPSGITDVMIVGGKEYQRVMRAAVAELQSYGIIDPDATINATSGAIGVQRQQLGEYLRAMQPETPVLANEPFTIDVEARVIDDNVALLPRPDIHTLEKHYGVKRGTAEFVQMVKEDIVRFANEGAEAVAKAIREIIRKLHAGVLSMAIVFNPTNITPPEFVFHPSYTYTVEEQVLAEVPDAAVSRMSPSARQAYKVLYPSVKDRLIKDNKFMVIADKPSARIFVFRPDGSLLLDKKSLFGLAQGDFYKGNSDLPQNRITPAGHFTMGLRDAMRSPSEARTAGEYDFKKVFVLDKAIDGEYSVTMFHSVWLNETDAAARARALESEEATNSRYSFGCINVDKPTYSILVNNHLQQMDGASLFVVPDDPANLAAMLSGQQKVGDELTRTGFKPVTITVAKNVPLQSVTDRKLPGETLAGERRKKGSDFLMNVEEPYTDQDVRQSQFIREDQIKEYAKLRAKLARVPKQVSKGEVGLDTQETVTRLMQQTRELNYLIRATAPRRDSAEKFMAKALTEYDNGNIDEEVLNVIRLAYDKYPDLLEGLLLSVKAAPKGKSMAAGQFLPFERIVRLYKGTSGIYDPVTIRHELSHSLEQMMTPEQRMAVVQAWGKALMKAIKQYPDELHQKYFHAVMDFIDRPNEETFRKAQAALPSYEMYQFINPSEFWAVNAEKLMAAELGGAWDKFKRAIRRLWEGLKNVFGFDNRYVVQKTFKDVMNGRRERVTKEMLVDLVASTGGQFTTLENIEDEKNLMSKYNRPHTPQLDTTPLKTFITRQFKNGKEFFQDAAENPREAMVGAGDSVMDGMIYLRNKNVWYGSGLEARDFDRYNGELKTSQGFATASVALDNAIRSGNIGVEVIFKGGLKFDKDSNNFVAVERGMGMKGVYEAEAKLKKKLGNQLGTDIIQGHLEAKRSISIMNELYERESAYEVAKEQLKYMKENNGTEEEIAEAQAVKDAALVDLDAIKKAASSVNMSEEEMYEFAQLDKKHSELRDIMDNWTAINQNLLKVWRQVGLLSEGRYNTLAAIQDYVPWFRIMNDEEDVHSPLQATTRTLTNIGREKLFKRGKPLSVVDFRAKDGQKDFKIQPSSVVKVMVNGKPVAEDLVSVTPSGDVRLDMDLKENDLVVFQTNREIENIIDNMTRNVMRMTMNGIRQAAANRIVLEYASRNEKGKIMVFPSVDKEKGRFNWVVNGKKVVVEIQDPLVAESIYGMENLNLQMWAPLAAVANLTRRTITLSGVFQIKQVFKDAPTAALVTGVKNPIALIGGVWKGFLTSLTFTDPVVDILKAAGIGGFHSPARTPEAEIKRRLGIMNRNVFSAVIKGLDHIGDASDMAQRVAVYKRVMAETGNETQALYQAANVINFLHHGSAGYAQAAVKVVPFLGAYANSMDVLIRALMGGGLKGMSRKKALLRLSITMSVLVSLTLLYCMLAGADPEYDELDDQTKLKNIIIPGTKIILPMNTSAAYFFKAIPELIYNKVTREGTDNEYDRRRIRKALGDAARDMLLGPEPIPAGIKPAIEVAINHDFFTGRPVIPEGLKDVEAAEQYTASTSELGKKLSALLAIPGTDGKRVLNPIEADHIIRGVFGTAGAMGQWVSNSIGAMAEERPEPTAKEAPITGSFLRDEVPRGREDLFYDFKSAVNEKYQTWKKMMDRGDYDAADAYLEKNGDVAAMNDYIVEAEDELKEINAEIRRIGETREKDMTPKERREAIEDYKRLKAEILEPVKDLRREVLK